MERDLRKLSDRSFDVAVVGGGIYGVSIARDAALRGLAVALVEKEDFGGATSANSHKIVHGGLRYLQNADLRRMRESIHERSALLRIAPHLVRPQAFLMPTYGHGVRGREALCVALWLNDLLSLDRNRALEPARQIPPGRIVSRSECLRLAPGIPEEGLTGGALWHDGLTLNSERLLFAILRSAIDAGAEAANYAEATEMLLRGGRGEGIQVRDVFSGERFDVRARVLVNATGPWSLRGLGGHGSPRPASTIGLAKAMNLVTRPILGAHAIGVARRFREAGGALRSDRRLFFLVPWRDRTLIGTAYLPYDGAPDGFAITEPEIERFLDEVNSSYPPARLSRADVRLVHGGLVPVVGSREAAADVELATRYQIRDHAAEGLEGMITVTGVKYTTARGVAAAVVDRVSAKLGAKTSRSRSAHLPVWGGDIERIEEYEAEALRSGVTATTVRRLVAHYGSRHREVFAEVAGDERRLSPIAEGTEVTGAEVVFAVRREMAVKLSDVVFRRTDLGSAGHPGEPALEAAATLVAGEFGWDEARVASELAEVRRRFP